MCKRKTLLIFLLASICIILSACGSTQPAQPIASSTPRRTSTPTLKPTTAPTATPKPIPEIMAYLRDYFAAHEAKDEYQIRKMPELSYRGGPYEMWLVYDEAPNSNGTAIVQASEGSNTVEINFSASNFMGAEICAPALIKSVTTATTRALAEIQGVEDVEPFVKKVIASYDETQYTYIVVVGDYSFIFSPKDVYVATLTAVDHNDFRATFDSSKYVAATYEDLNTKLNASSRYFISGTVSAYESGKYANSFATYKCKIITVQLDSGETISVAHYPNNVPISFEVGMKYTFYGTTMFDKAGSLLFYLHYAE